jgi:hypothetical protein
MKIPHHLKIHKKFEDSHLTITTAKHGYYEVGDKIFNNKLNAVLEASRSPHNMSWNFNHNIFEKQAKMPRLAVPLTELYRQRALQLREQYDYIIIAYSGGADSDTILKTFLDNNIPIDEIWTDYSKDLVEKSGYVLDPYSRDTGNMPAEYFLVAFPEIQKVQQSHPEIKIHVSDSLIDGFVSDQGEDQNDTIMVASAALSHGGIRRARYIQEYMNRISKGKKMALIQGIDKLIPIIVNDEYGFVFTDRATLNKGDIIDNSNSYIEYFYWTPDFPQIVTEQGHRIWDFLHANHEFMKIRMQVQLSSNWMDRERSFDGIIKKICYPSWDFSKLQVDKGIPFNNREFAWLERYHNDRFFQSSQSFMISIFNMIDRSKYLDPRYPDKYELRPYYNFHSLGKLPDLNTLNFKKNI